MNYHEELRALLSEQKKHYLMLEKELKRSLSLSEELEAENQKLNRALETSEITVKNSITVIQNLEKELEEEKRLRFSEGNLLTRGLTNQLKEWKELAENLSLENSKQQAFIENLMAKVRG